MLSSKFNLSPITQLHVVRFEKFLHKQGLFFITMVLSANNPMLSSEMNILSHYSVISGQIWKIPSQTGVFVLRQLFWVPTTLCYLQNWMFHPICLFISILFALCQHKPYFFLLFKCNFDSLEWQFGTYCFNVDIKTFSKIKLICVPTDYYWLIPCSAVNSIFFLTFNMYARYM